MSLTAHSAGTETYRTEQVAFDDVTFGAPANASGTIYLCVADPYGNSCSFINSNFAGVGTGIVPSLDISVF